jgi:hypothetical protein
MKTSSPGECVQRVVSGINYIASYGTTCNGKPNCRIIPSRLTLNECAAKAASYLHIDYVCALSINFIILTYGNYLILVNLI